jgi:cell division protease FtsH
MDNFTFVAIGAVLIFIYFLFFKNKKAAHKEMNSLSEINYKNKSSISFDDIAGNYEAKESLMELVDFIKNPDKYKDFNIRTPKGVLLYGSPGTGKTLLAQALAGEAEVDFFAVSGSDFVQVYAGLGASRIRNLFSKAKKAKKSVIFIDEIDAIGKQRQGFGSRGNDESDRTLNALLTEMSGFENSSTIVLAATNRIDTLDSALLRPGRFDRQIEIMLPDKQARKEIIKLYLDKANADKDVDIDKLAELTVYFSGAMIENLVNEASILAIKDKNEKNAGRLTNEHLEKAFFNVVAGLDKDNNIQNDLQKEVTAYHEAGHAFMSKHLNPENKIIRVSIIPTTKGAGGYTLSTVENETVISKEKIENQLKILLAGRATEEIFLGENKITTGAQNDIEKTTALAMDYISKYGMDKDAGLVNYKILSETFAISMDIEKSVKKLISDSYSEVLKIISENKEYLKLIKEILVEKEIIDDDDLCRVLSIKTAC